MRRNVVKYGGMGEMKRLMDGIGWVPMETSK